MKAGGKYRFSLAACIAALFVLPSVLIGLLCVANATLLRKVVPEGYFLTNFGALKRMLSSISAGDNDSWTPMLNAISVLHNARDHARLYETVFFDLKMKFQYPPTSLLPLDLLERMHLASLPFLNGLNLFVFVANAAALAWIAALLFNRKDQGAEHSSQSLSVRIGVVAIVFMATFFFYPLVQAKLLGQIQLWVDLLMTLTVLCWLLDRRVLAGMLIGLTCILKPQAAILFVWAIVWKEWGIARGIIFTAGPILGVSLLTYGIHNHIAYLKVLSYLSAHGETYFPNNSVNGLLNRMLHNGESLTFLKHSFPPFNPVVYAGTMAFAIAAMISILAPAWLGRRPATSLDLAAAMICSVIMSPIAWEHHYGILAPLYLVALHTWLNQRSNSVNYLELAALALSWTLTATFDPLTNLLADGPYGILQSYIFLGALILLGLIFWWRNKEHIRPISVRTA